MKLSVCITVLNSPNPSSVYIRLCKHGKKVFYCFYKITSSKNYMGKDFLKKFILLIKTHLPTTLTMAFLNWPIKTYISKSGDGVFTTRVSLHHTTMFTYSHATTPLGQSERAYYLGYFINKLTMMIITVVGASIVAAVRSWSSRNSSTVLIQGARTRLIWSTVHSLFNWATIIYWKAKFFSQHINEVFLEQVFF